MTTGGEQVNGIERSNNPMIANHLRVNCVN